MYVVVDRACKSLYAGNSSNSTNHEIYCGRVDDSLVVNRRLGRGFFLWKPRFVKFNVRKIGTEVPCLRDESNYQKLCYWMYSYAHLKCYLMWMEEERAPIIEIWNKNGYKIKFSGDFYCQVVNVFSFYVSNLAAGTQLLYLHDTGLQRVECIIFNIFGSW